MTNKQAEKIIKWIKLIYLSIVIGILVGIFCLPLIYPELYLK